MLHVSFERLTNAALCNLRKYVRFAWGDSHAREPLYSNIAVIAWWSQSTSGKNRVFMCTMLLKTVINFLIFYF